MTMAPKALQGSTLKAHVALGFRALVLGSCLGPYSAVYRDLGLRVLGLRVLGSRA